MNWFEGLVLGVVQGLTEFLPIGFLLRFLKRHGTYAFVVYRILLGVLILFTL
jgi:undecaprenyl pyrophosphate phosphatase UppP